MSCLTFLPQWLLLYTLGLACPCLRAQGRGLGIQVHDLVSRAGGHTRIWPQSPNSVIKCVCAWHFLNVLSSLRGLRCGGERWGSKLVSLETGTLGLMDQNRNYIFAHKKMTGSTKTLEGILSSLLHLLLPSFWG